MKMKLFATLALLAIAASTQAANVSINDVNITQGDATAVIPIMISTATNEMIGASNISFSAGTVGDAIPILSSGTEFTGTLWDATGTFFSVAGTPAVHNVFSAVAKTSPLQVLAQGVMARYTLDTSALAPGTYALNPNFMVGQIGTGATDGSLNPITLSFTPGNLNVAPIIPEPSTVLLAGVFGLLGLGVAIKRRRAVAC